MNTHEHDDTVYQTTAQTMESLAMMFLLPEQEVPQPPPPCSRRAAVTFRGPFDGTLVLAASEGLLPELAANMLGAESGQATAAQQEDALKELTNVVCGNLLPALAGVEPVFHISAPWLLEAGADERKPDGILAGSAFLHTDAGSVQVALYVGECSPALS